MWIAKTVQWIFLSGLTLAALNATDSAAGRISWDDFSARLTQKHTIRMVLPDGTHIEGRPLQTEPNALHLVVTRTSNKQAHPKGNATIRRESVSVVQVRNPRWAGKLIGTLAPIGVGAAILGAGARVQGDVYGYLAAGGITIALGTPVGFFVGRAVDRRFHEFVIIPESRSTDR